MKLSELAKVADDADHSSEALVGNPYAVIAKAVAKAVLAEAAKLCDQNYPCDCCADYLKSHPEDESTFCESYGCHSFKAKAEEIRSLATELERESDAR